jgi:hypothetical protein
VHMIPKMPFGPAGNLVVSTAKLVSLKSPDKGSRA